MKLKYLYGWIVGKKTAFVNSFDNDPLQNQADVFWRHLESGTWFYLLAFIIVAIIFAYFYFKPFNNQPGRHFRPRYWVIFGVVSIIVSFLLTLLIAYLAAAPKLQGSFILELKISFANMIYTAVTYFVMSILFWNNVFGKTNAYKLIKL